jgi:hypothetical protein
VTGVVLPRHRAARVTPAVTKTAAGAVEYLRFCDVGGIPHGDRSTEQGRRRDRWSGRRLPPISTTSISPVRRWPSSSEESRTVWHSDA